MGGTGNIRWKGHYGWTDKHDHDNDRDDNDNDDFEDDSTYSEENTNSYTPTAIISLIKTLYFQEVDNTKIFDHDLYTTTDIYNQTAKIPPLLGQCVTVAKFGKLLSQANIGKKVTRRISGKPVGGRSLYRVKDLDIGGIVEEDSSF